MGIFYSYFYYSTVAEEEGKKGEKEGEEAKKGSDPNYTLLYPPQEEEFQRKAAEEAREREIAQVLQQNKESSNGRISEDVWNNMSPDEKKRHLKKQRVKKYRQKKRQADKVDALAVKKKELLPWLEDLTARQRTMIKEVMWRVPEDPSLLSYIRKRKDELIQCPNRYCSLYFERIVTDNKSKAPLVLGYDGKPITEQALENFMDNRFKCYHCETIFCNECKTIPYHLGETCDQYVLRTSNPPCKVCKKPISPPPDEASKKEVTCRAEDCLNMVHKMCGLTVSSCKHPCAGMKDQLCFCLRPSCIEAQKLTQEAGDFCNICWTDELDAGTCIKLTCGHVFHRYCVEQRLKHKWTGARISFHYANCPLCQKPIETTADHSINCYLNNTRDLRNEVKIKALHFLKAEGLMDDVKNPKHKYHGNPVDYAIDVFSFYMCFKCNSPYFGGRRQCGEILNFNPEELVCGGCSGLLSCEKENHGRKYIQYKCRFCCSIAGWFCFGRVHYCENCHNNPYEYWACNNTLVGVPPQCKGKASCPLGIDHPPNGFEEMSLGCSRCKLEEAGIILEENGDDDDMDDDYY